MKRLISALGVVAGALAVMCAFTVPAGAAEGIFAWSASAGQSSRIINPVNHYCYQLGGTLAKDETTSVAVLYADANCTQPVGTVYPGREHTVPFSGVQFFRN